jgi:hypothetical protein
VFAGAWICFAAPPRFGTAGRDAFDDDLDLGTAGRRRSHMRGVRHAAFICRLDHADETHANDAVRGTSVARSSERLAVTTAARRSIARRDRDHRAPRLRAVLVFEGFLLPTDQAEERVHPILGRIVAGEPAVDVAMPAAAGIVEFFVVVVVVVHRPLLAGAPVHASDRRRIRGLGAILPIRAGRRCAGRRALRAPRSRAPAWPWEVVARQDHRRDARSITP